MSAVTKGGDTLSRIVDRSMRDEIFLETLRKNPTDALEEYDLSEDEF